MNNEYPIFNAFFPNTLASPGSLKWSNLYVNYLDGLAFQSGWGTMWIKGVWTTSHTSIYRITKLEYL